MEQTLKFELTVQQANVILQALSEIPFKVAQPLIQELQKQAQGQLPEVEAAEEAAE